MFEDSCSDDSKSELSGVDMIWKYKVSWLDLIWLDPRLNHFKCRSQQNPNVSPLKGEGRMKFEGL